MQSPFLITDGVAHFKVGLTSVHLDLLEVDILSVVWESSSLGLTLIVRGNVEFTRLIQKVLIHSFYIVIVGDDLPICTRSSTDKLSTHKCCLASIFMLYPSPLS